MSIRLLPFFAIVTAVAVAVLLAGIGQRRARGPMLAGLVVAVAVQAAGAIYVVISGQPAVTLTATVVRHDAIKVEEEPSPFSGPGEIVAAQFRVIGKPQGSQAFVGRVATQLDSQLTSDAGTLRGSGNVGDLLITTSSHRHWCASAAICGSSGGPNGLTSMEIVRTDPDGAYTATVQAQCALCLSTAGSGWQLRAGRLLTLLSFALLLTACA